MKKLISLLVFTAFLSASLFSDTIYLKNGDILRGKIIDADTKTITIETETKWFKIDRKDIEKIAIDDKEVIKETTPKEKPEEKTEEKKDSYYQGKNDGEIAGGAENQMVAGGAAGCCVGPIGYLFIPMAATEPKPEQIEKIKNKSIDYQQGYRDGYKGKKKSQFITGVTIGWGAWLALMLIALSSGGE